MYVSFVVAMGAFETERVEETGGNVVDSEIDGTEEVGSDDWVDGTDGIIGVEGITVAGKTVGKFTDSDLSLRKQKKTNAFSYK